MMQLIQNSVVPLVFTCGRRSQAMTSQLQHLPWWSQSKVSKKTSQTPPNPELKSVEPNRTELKSIEILGISWNETRIMMIIQWSGRKKNEITKALTPLWDVENVEREQCSLSYKLGCVASLEEMWLQHVPAHIPFRWALTCCKTSQAAQAVCIFVGRNAKTIQDYALLNKQALHIHYICITSICTFTFTFITYTSSHPIAIPLKSFNILQLCSGLWSICICLVSPVVASKHATRLGKHGEGIQWDSKIEVLRSSVHCVTVHSFLASCSTLTKLKRSSLLLKKNFHLLPCMHVCCECTCFLLASTMGLKR